MVDRRRFLYGVILMLGMPLAAEAQESSLPRVVVVGPSALAHPLAQSFEGGMRDRGYVRGRNVNIMYRWDVGAAEITRLKPQIIVAAGSLAIEAATSSTRAVAIVVAGCDVEATGLIVSRQRPGHTLTGVSCISSKLARPRLRLLKEAVPALKRVAVLYNAGHPGKLAEWGKMQAAAQALGLQAESFEVREQDLIDEDEFEKRLVAVRARVDALIAMDDVLLVSYLRRIVNLVAKHRLPAMYPSREYAEQGGLLAYGPALPDMSRRAALYTERILRGANPAMMALEEPTKIELIINRRNARWLGLVMPPSLLRRADQVLE